MGAADELKNVARNATGKVEELAGRVGDHEELARDGERKQAQAHERQAEERAHEHGSLAGTDPLARPTAHQPSEQADEPAG